MRFPLIFGVICIAAMIGLRRGVGTDFYAYYAMYKMAGLSDLSHLFSFGDPGYQLINWLVQQIGGGFWLVNSICASVFAWGLYKLAKIQPNPWAAMMIAVPYLVIVVAMGYTRQGVAIGILMAGIAALCRGGPVTTFLVYIAVAALFHRTAVIALPLGLFGSSNRRALQFLVALGGGLVVFDYLLSNHVDEFINAYVETQWDSKGAGIRVAMSVTAAVMFFVARNRLQLNDVEKGVWRNFAIGALVSLILLFLVPSSTAIDRVSLYLIPLQIVVLSRASFLMRTNILSNATICLYCFAILFTWLNFGINAVDWVPYRYYWPGETLASVSGGL